MKHFLTLFFLTLSIFASSIEAKSSIQWLTNYDQAVKQAKEQSKPILLFFTGSDWCGWCQKLDKEALGTAEFAKLAKDKFVFVCLDFPSKTQPSPEETTQNQELQKKFNVRGFPTIILLNSSGQQIGITGYRPGGGAEYAEHLLRIVKDYSGYKEQILSMNGKKLPGSDLKTLYEKAKIYRAKEDEAAIMQKGMLSNQSDFFMLEKVRDYANEDNLNCKEAITLRETLLMKDPDNVNQTHYHLAVIEFEARYKEMKNNKRSTKSTIAPLISYIDKFGTWDKENIWRLKMIISQVLYDHQDFKEALKYAQDSLNNAPTPYQNDIVEVINDINSQMEYYR